MKSNKYISDVKKCEQFVTNVEMERFICYNRKTGVDISRWNYEWKDRSIRD